MAKLESLTLSVEKLINAYNSKNILPEWFLSNIKTLLSKNITLDDWNLVQENLKRLAAENEAVFSFCKELGSILTNFEVNVDSAIQAVQTNLNKKIDNVNTGVNMRLKSYPKLENGIIPSKYLPSYMDDIVEVPGIHLITEGETGKIYVDINTGITYRWSGSQFVSLTDPNLTAELSYITQTTIPGLETSIQTTNTRVSDLEYITIPELETSIMATNTRISEVDQIIIPKIQEDIESLKGGSGNTPSKILRWVSNDELEQSMSGDEISIDISTSTDVGIIFIDWDNTPSELSDYTSKISITLNPNQKVIVKGDNTLLPKQFEFISTETVGYEWYDSELNNNLAMPYIKGPEEFIKIIDTMSTDNVLFYFDDVNYSFEFTIEHDNQLNSYYYHIQNSLYNEI